MGVEMIDKAALAERRRGVGGGKWLRDTMKRRGHDQRYLYSLVFYFRVGLTYKEISKLLNCSIYSLKDYYEKLCQCGYELPNVPSNTAFRAYYAQGEVQYRSDAIPMILPMLKNKPQKT
jgi:hypothetical protein